MKLREPISPKDKARRDRLIARAVRIKGEIELIFNTARHWNERVRLPHERPIDPDPKGELARALQQMEEIISGAEPRVQ